MHKHTFLFAFGLAASLLAIPATAGKWLTGIGESLQEAKEDALKNARELANSRGTCVTGTPSIEGEHKCRKIGDPKIGHLWQCEAEAADHVTSCGKKKKHSLGTEIREGLGL
jgi:hypothetical protein